MRVRRQVFWIGISIVLAFGVAALGRASDAQAVDPATQAIAWLHAQQLEDGGFGINGVSAAGLTADVVYVLALSGEDPAGPTWTVSGHSALDALAALASPYAKYDAGQAGKVARAVAVAGGNPRHFGGLDLIEVIRSAYDPATGRYHPNLLFRHTLAVEALLRAGEPAPQAAVKTLLQAQLPDGGWFWAFDGVEGDVDTTGRVLQLLAGQVGLRCVSAYGRAVEYLASGQLADGGWGVQHSTGPANADSTALAVAGLRAAGYDPQAPRFQKRGRGALDTLITFQEMGGAFVYIQQPGREEVRLVATVDALNALAQKRSEPVACLPSYLPIVLAMG